MWRFLEGVSSPSTEKKVKQKPVPYTHQDVTFLRRHFAPFVGKKGDPGATALYGGKGKAHRIAFMAKLTDRDYL